MTLVLDAAPLIAVADRRDPMRSRIEELLREESGELVIPAPVTAEVDYLLGRRLGRVARLAFLDDLAAGRFTVACLEAGDHGVVADLERRYHDLDVGLADLSVVVVAGRSSTRRILTFDERHFRALGPLDGGQFILLPSDIAAR
ncbi:MAG: type II toxin-antitoxin system VapC family toxin [Acidimicrobiales bacterium]